MKKSDSYKEHPDNQLTMRSIISQRSIHKHEAVQHPELLADRTIETEHAAVQTTIRSAAEFAAVFQQKNVDAIELAWSDLSVYAGSNNEKTLLTGASGKVQASFLAIMGPSGAGKSTLMNVLACRVGGVSTEGDKVIDGINYSLTELKQVAGYVMQDDLLNGRLTVAETLYYTAELRLPSDMSAEEKKERIESVMKRLSLTHVRDIIIGDSFRRGISGGERKRVCVAMELLTKPRLLFLDEPTSGLDSVTALSLCEILRDLAHSGECTVITTIHQPQTKIFNMFDDLILLKSGRIVYYGSAGQVTDFFAEAGYPCPDKTNPADHVLDVITANPAKTGSKEAVEEAEERLLQLASTRVTVDDSKETNKASKIAHKHKRPSWFHQFTVLLRRSFQEQVRDKQIFFTLLIQNVIIALLIGAVFFQIGITQSSVVRRQPVLFFCVINQGVFAALMTINSFPKERALVLRERAAGTYQVSAYFLAKNIAEVAGQIVAPMVFSCIVYWMIGLQPLAGKFFIFMLFMVLCNIAACSLAIMVATLSRTTDMAVVILPMALELCRLYGGFFLSPKNLPVYFIWLDALSYVKYTYTGVSLNELQGLTLTCTNAQLKPDGSCAVTSGQQVINDLGLDYITIGGCIGALFAMIIGFRFIAYLGIRYLK